MTRSRDCRWRRQRRCGSRSQGRPPGRPPRWHRGRRRISLGGAGCRHRSRPRSDCFNPTEEIALKREQKCHDSPAHVRTVRHSAKVPAALGTETAFPASTSNFASFGSQSSQGMARVESNSTPKSSASNRPGITLTRSAERTSKCWMERGRFARGGPAMHRPRHAPLTGGGQPRWPPLPRRDCRNEHRRRNRKSEFCRKRADARECGARHPSRLTADP